MPKTLKKFVLSFLSFSILFFSVAPNFLIANAASPTPAPTWYNQDFKSWLGKVDNTSNPSEIFGERYTSAQVQWVIYGLFAFILHSSINSEVLGCVLSNSVDLNKCAAAIKNISQTPTSTQGQNLNAVTANKSLLSLVFADRPISGIGYVKSKIQNFSLIPIAHAQTVGFGFDSLKPIQDMWSASRNIAFGLFVLAAIIFSFMIMFRVKISPQVIITVQSAIPKLIISLILVTFSYAIAGFLIDFMYIIIGLLSVFMASFLPTIFPAIDIKVPPSAVFSLLTQGNLLGVVGINIQTGIFGLIFSYLSPLILVFFILTIVVAVLSGGLLFWIPLILFIVVVIVAIWISIKTVWALLKAFVNVILLTIFAPLQIVLGTIMPNFGFGQWVKSYLSNLSVFIVTGALYFLSLIFLVQGMYIGLKDIAGDLLVLLINPIFGGISIGIDIAKNYTTFPPLLGSGTPQGIGVLLLGVSFVLFTMIPKATELVQSLLSGKPFAYGTAIGEAVGPIRWAGGQVYNQTGAREMVEAVQALGKSRRIESLFGQGRPLRPVVERVAGGSDQAKETIDAAVERTKHVGR